jgi:hypothetical protein
LVLTGEAAWYTQQSLIERLYLGILSIAMHNREAIDPSTIMDFLDGFSYP